MNSGWFNGPSLAPTPTPTPTLDLKKAIVTALNAETALTSIVGSNIYPDVIPETSVGPAISYEFFAADRVKNILGAAGMKTTRVRFELLSALESDVEAMAEVLRNLIQGLRGKLGGVLTILYVSYLDETDGDYEPIAGSDQQTHFKRVDYSFKLRETLPTLT